MRPLTIGTALVVVLTMSTGWSVSAQGDAAAASAEAFSVWTPNQLSKPGRLGNFGNHNASIQSRQPGNLPEVHDGFSHILMFTSGRGSFVIGGEIVDGPEGKKIIRGGEKYPIVAGVIYHIPVKVAHWVVPEVGSSVTYFVANVNVP